MTRILPVVRLSHLTDPTTSPERQREQLLGYAKMAQGATSLPPVEDLDISGALSPFQRKGLGPWLTEPAKLAQWDTLAVANVARLTRSLADFVAFLDWAEAHGKKLVSVEQMLDFSTPHGRMIAQMLALFAEYERAVNAEHRRDAGRNLRAAARYGGGPVPFGYRPEPDNGGWVLVPDPDLAPAAREMAEAILAGRSATEIAADLNDRGIPTAVAAQAARLGKTLRSPTRWTGSTVLKVLRSPSLKGYVLHTEHFAKGQKRRPPVIVRGPSGMPVRRTPLVSAEMWERVQARLDSNARRHVHRHGVALLSGILECADHDDRRPMWTNRRQDKGVWYAYYTCKTHGYTRMADLDAEITRQLLTAHGADPAARRVEIPASDTTAELREVDQAIADLETDRYERGLFRGESGAARYAALMTKLETRREALAATPPVPARTIWEEIPGRTWADLWADLDTEGRNRVLREMDVRAVYDPASGLLVVNLRTFEDARRALAAER